MAYCEAVNQQVNLNATHTNSDPPTIIGMEYPIITIINVE